MQQVADGVVLLELDNPDSLNAVSTAMQHELDEALAAAERAGDVRCLVLAGAGDRAFSAGYDIHELTTMTADEHEYVQSKRDEWLWHWFSTPIPTVAATGGLTYGAGALLALCSTLRVGGPSTKLKVTASSYGGANLTWLLGDLIGWSRATDVLITSRTVAGEEAFQLGLLNRFVPDADIRETAIALAAQIAALPPEGVQAVKRLIREGAGLDVSRRYQVENTLMHEAFGRASMSDVFSPFLSRNGRP